VAERESRPTATDSGGPWRAIARAIVWLRFLIVAAWIAAAVLATVHLPSAFESENADAGSLLPHSSRAIEVEEGAIKTFGLPLISRTMVVASEPRGFSAAALSAATKYIAATDQKEGKAAIRAVPLLDANGVLAAKRTATTLVVYLYIPTTLSESEGQGAAEGFAAGLQRATGAEATKVTGALPGTRAETEVATSHILWVEIATVVLVVAIRFRVRRLRLGLLGVDRPAESRGIEQAEGELGGVGHDVLLRRTAARACAQEQRRGRSGRVAGWNATRAGPVGA